MQSWSLSLAIAASTAATAAKEPSGPPKRARPPKWSADVLDAFFPMPATKLVGTRPDYEQATAVAGSNDAERTATQRRGSAADRQRLVEADRRRNDRNRNQAARPGRGQGRDDAQRNSKAAATRIAAGTSACWPRCSPSRPSTTATSAGRMRPPRFAMLFARAGHNCKVGTDQTFQEATQRKQDLADLIARQSAQGVRRRTQSRLGPGRRPPAADATHEHRPPGPAEKMAGEQRASSPPIATTSSTNRN